MPHAQRIVAALLGLGVVGVLVAGLAGWWAGGRASAPPAPSPDAARTASAGPVELSVGADWVPVPRVPGLTGLPAATAAFTPAASLRAYSAVSVTPVDHPSLLPPALRAIMPAKLPQPRTTSLIGLPAWRYGELAVSGGRLLEVTVVPSTAGTLSIACIAPRASWVAALGCADDVRRLTLAKGATWLPPAPDLAVRERIPGTMAKLDDRRVALRAKLRAAKTRGGQARFAGRLAGAYDDAVAAIAPVAPATGAAAAVAVRLKASAAAYRKLSAAAGGGLPNRYKQARRAAKASDAKLKAALATLGRG